MIEDDSYMTSSQYRLWSFTAEQLQDRRTETNRYASEKVRAAWMRARSSTSNGHTEGNGDMSTTEPNIDTLTVDEEQSIVRWGCEKILEMKMNLDPPPSSQVTATAVQFLRRFYLFNSPMTYHPKQIVVCALFLASKSDHFYIPLARFANQLDVTEDEVKAPEFLMMQALRFTLEVRHSIRGLDGGMAEIRLRAPDLKCFKGMQAAEIKRQIDAAGDRARRILVADTQMTDAYFLYTPAQIWLAAMLIVDKTLTTDYIENLFDRVGSSIAPIKQRLIDTITKCANLIQAYKSPENDKSTKAELGRIGKKLRKCQDPEKMDMVALAQAKAAEKREGNDSDIEKAAKKRKLGRERAERDAEVFGTDLKKAKD